MADALKTQAKERTRGPNLAILILRSKGVPMEEAIRRADDAGMVIASNNKLGLALEEKETWEGIKEAFPCWSGTMAAYDRPDKKLGKIIEHVDERTGIRYVFPVPEEHQGRRNLLLVAEHPDFKIEKDGKTRIVMAKKPDIVARFSVNLGGWFHGDPAHGIPQGKESSEFENGAIYPQRTDKRVGLVARHISCYPCIDIRHHIFLDRRVSERYGVVIEAAEPAPLALIPSREGELIVRGTPQQIAAASRLLEKVK